MEEDLKVTLAQIRVELREIDSKVAAIRHDAEFYRRLGFGRDVKDIQLMALQDERAKLVARLRTLERKSRQSRTRNQPLISWLLLPVLLLLMGMDAVAPKRRSPRERFLETRWRPQPQARVSFDLG